ALAGFGARLNVAYAIGLIRSDVRDDLLTIAKIRNRVAHSHLRLSFDDPSIRDHVANLRYLEKGMFPNVEFRPQFSIPRVKFVLTVGFLSHILLVRARRARRFKIRERHV